MNKKKVQNPKFKSQSGYTLLFAVLTATLVLGVAIFILGVSRKQLALAVAARDSMYSIYAADSGIECASAISDISTSTLLSIQCNGKTFTLNSAGSVVSFASVDPNNSSVSGMGFDVTASPSVPVYQASGLIIDLPDSTCSVITVTDGYYLDASDGSRKNRVIIDSRGYNYCKPTLTSVPGNTSPFGPKASSRTVERALRLSYE